MTHDLHVTHDAMSAMTALCVCVSVQLLYILGVYSAGANSASIFQVGMHEWCWGCLVVESVGGMHEWCWGCLVVESVGGMHEWCWGCLVVESVGVCICVWTPTCTSAVLQNAIPVWGALLTTISCVEKFRYSKVGTRCLTHLPGAQ